MYIIWCLIRDIPINTISILLINHFRIQKDLLRQSMEGNSNKFILTTLYFPIFSVCYSTKQNYYNYHHSIFNLIPYFD